MTATCHPLLTANRLSASDRGHPGRAALAVPPGIPSLRLIASHDALPRSPLQPSDLRRDGCRLCHLSGGEGDFRCVPVYHLFWGISTMSLGWTISGSFAAGQSSLLRAAYSGKDSPTQITTAIFSLMPLYIWPLLILGRVVPCFIRIGYI
jgi:hypothetical protein